MLILRTRRLNDTKLMFTITPIKNFMAQKILIIFVPVFLFPKFSMATRLVENVDCDIQTTVLDPQPTTVM